MKKEENLYYIQDSRSCLGSAMIWWAKSGNGHTTNIDKASQYNYEDAMKIQENRSTDLAWPVDYINKRISRFIDIQDCFCQDRENYLKGYGS